MSKSIIRLPEVMRRTGEPRSTIYEKIERKEFPKQVPLGVKSVGWVEQEVDAYVESKIAARDAEESGAAR